MCLHVQYIQRLDAHDVFLRGFNSLYQGSNLVCFIGEKSFSSNGYIRLPWIKTWYVNHDDENDIVYTREQRDPQKKYYKEFSEDMTLFSLVNEETGESLPLYNAVPCGNCVVCQDIKRSKTSNRCILQSCVSGKPFFLTLTINDENLYHFRERTQKVQEMQKFLKRLRKRLICTYGIDFKETPLKYVIVSEYGSKSGRFHFHALIWLDNNEMHSYRSFYDTDTQKAYTAPLFSEAVKSCWKFGYCKVENASDMTGKYCFKYMSKQRGNIKLQSKLLGWQKVEEFKEVIFENPQMLSFPVVDLDGQTHEIPITDYMTRKIYPTFARSIDKELRDEIISLYNEIYPKQLFNKDFKYLQEYLDRHFQDLNFPLKSLGDAREREFAATPLSCLSSSYIERYLNLKDKMCKLDFKYCSLCDKKNKEHVRFVMSNMSEDDTVRAVRIIRKQQLLIEKEII